MMWNYLVSGLLVGRDRRALRRRPAWPDLATLWRLAAESGATYSGRARRSSWPAARPAWRPAGTLDLAALRGVGSTGAPLPAAGFRWVRDAVSADDPGRLAERRHGPVHRVPRAAPARAGLGGRDQLPDAGRGGRGVRRRRAVRRGARRRARDHRADAVHAGRVLGRHGRVPAARRVLRDVPGRLAPRRLADDHRARLVRHHRPQRRDAQPRWRADWHGASSTAWWRRCPRSPTASSSISRTRAAARASCCCSSCRAAASTLDDDLRRRIAAALRGELSPRHVPD